MSKEIDEQWTLDLSIVSNQESQKKDKLLYSRDFLLSLSESEACKTLPSGFDLSVLSEFNDAFSNLQSRKRVPGKFSFQSFRCGENGSSPPTSGDSSNYSQGVHGRWDSRSSGQVDGDSIPHSDRDTDFGKRYGYQSRRSWKIPEHDGLLGSGSFSRPSESANAPKARANDHYQLNRCSEPYHPPRPYKAPHLLKEAKDSYNDETFGSSDSMSHDKSEEERKRRDSFDLMRKEQKDLLEKQKLNPDQAKGKLLSDISFLLKENDNKEILNAVNVDNALDESHTELGPPNVLGKSYYSLKVPSSKPLVPPGFTNGLVGRDFATKSSSQSFMEEVVDNINLPDDTEDNPTLDLTSSQIKRLDPNMGCSIQQFGEDILKSSSALSNNMNRVNDRSYKTDLDLFDTVENSQIVKLDTEKGLRHKLVGELGQEELSTSTSVLDKFFDTDFAINDCGMSSLIQNYNMKEDVMWIPSTTKSSRFSHWFLEEENKTAGKYTSSSPDDLFSLIVGGDNHRMKASNVESAEQIGPAFPFEISDNIDNQITSDVSLSSTVEISEKYNGNTPGVSAVLRCEDLEQSILSEISENINNLNPSIQDSGTEQQQRASNNDDASRHLLSLLQKGEALQEFAPPSNIEKEDCLEVKKSENVNNQETTTPTLETLFGSAFMKELHDSVGSARVDVLEPRGLPENEITNVLPSANNVGGHWLGLGFDDPHKAGDPMYVQSNVNLNPNQIRLPREGNLIGTGDPFGSSFSIGEKFGSLNVLKSNHAHMLHGQAGLPLQRDPHDLSDLEIPHPQMNHGRPFLHPFEARAAHLNPQFMSHSTNQIQIPGNTMHPHFSGLSGFDPRIQYALFNQMHTSGQFGHEQWQELSRVNPLQSQASGFMQDSGMVHGFPYGHQNPPFCSSGMPLPGGEEADPVQRLVHMEHMMNPIQVNPFPASDAVRGLYSDDR